MTNVLVCWEDRFHEELDRCLRRALRHGGLSSPQIYPIDCRGNGGFVPYIKRAWAIASIHGLPKTAGPINHLVCVADADRASECCDVEKPGGESTADWIDRANRAWTLKLRAAATVAPERISGRFLRWNQESLLIAAHDVDQALVALGCRDRTRVTKHLQGCSPSPLQVADAAFVDHFRRPERCLEDILRAAGVSMPKKGTSPRGDALQAASLHAIDRLCARVPDLAALADAISKLPAI